MMRKKRTLVKLFSLLLVLLMSTPFFQGTALAANTQPLKTSDFNILEVEPGTTYNLNNSMVSKLFPNQNVVLTQMPMPEFISKVDEINGQYDIVYIGNNTSGNAYYTNIGARASNLPNGANMGQKEYYSDNDITNLRANTLKDFVESKQLTIFDQSILNSASTLTSTKLYKNFIGYVNQADYPNFLTTTKSELASKLATYNNNTTGLAKRPSLKLNIYPYLYDGTDSSYQTAKSLGFNFNINNSSTANDMSVKLYIDLNGDGIFNELSDYVGPSEQVFEEDNLNSDNNYTINYRLPDSLVGLYPWKLELTDTSTGAKGAKSYFTGSTAFKASTPDGVIKVRVLQLEPKGNTFSIYSLNNVEGSNLLHKDNVYNIDVTEMNVTDFNAAYANLRNGQTPPQVNAKVNGKQTTAPTDLNGNYDMIIFGFADVYGSDDLTNNNSIKAVKDFINTNQSVMFTHDTLTFQVASPGSWVYNITQNFRNIVGQQRYFQSPNSYQDPMPPNSNNSYGFTNLTLDRYNKGTFQTTTQAHKLNDNLVTEFPFVLGDIPVSTTHFQYFQLNLEDKRVVPVYSLTNDTKSSIYNHPGDGRNDYYTYTMGNITYSGTGHSKVNCVPEEKMFVNTMIKATRGANHAPTLDVNGLSDGMNISNTTPSINFNFTATDLDPSDQYLNGDVYLATSTDGENFSPYQGAKQFSATSSDLSQRVESAVPKNISIPISGTSIVAYKVKVVVTDNSNAMVSQEFLINSVNDPSINVQAQTLSCLVGDTVNIPVNISAQKTTLNETFQNIALNGTLTNPDKTTANAYNATYPDLTFSPDSSWSSQQNTYPIVFGTSGKPNSAGVYSVTNKLTYTAYSGIPPILTKLHTRESDQTFSVNVASGTIDVEVVDQKGRGITGVPVNISGSSSSGTSDGNGLTSFTGLGTGSYTLTVSVPDGRTIEGSTSQMKSLSAATPYQKVIFTMGGNLLIDPRLTSPEETLQMTTTENAPLQTNIGVNLTRPATFLNFILNNSLTNSAANLAINKVICSDQEIGFTADSNNPGKISPSQATSFPSGKYTINATVTIPGVAIKAGDSFELTLDPQTSAQDANTQSEEAIESSPSPLTVKVIAMLTNPSFTTRSGSSQMDTLINAPLQTNIGFNLTGSANSITVDLTNSYTKNGESGVSTNIVVTKVLCENQGQVQEIGFKTDPSNSKTILPSDSTTFSSGNYTIYETVTIVGAKMIENSSYQVFLTTNTSIQDASTKKEVFISVAPDPVTVYVLTSPKYH